jgi:hypothetical protein
LDYVQPAAQVRKIAKLLGLAAIRLKRGKIPESLEISRKISESRKQRDRNWNRFVHGKAPRSNHQLLCQRSRIVDDRT